MRESERNARRIRLGSGDYGISNFYGRMPTLELARQARAMAAAHMAEFDARAALERKALNAEIDAEIASMTDADVLEARRSNDTVTLLGISLERIEATA